MRRNEIIGAGRGPLAVLLLGLVIVAGRVGAVAAPPETALSGQAAEVAALFGIEPRSELGPAPGLADYLGYALVHSPVLREAEERLRAADARPAQASAWPEPELHYEQMLGDPGAAMPMQERAVGIRQGVPWPGLLPARGRAERAMAAAAEARVAAVALEVVHAVRRAWWELAYQQEALAVTGQMLELLRGWEEAARASYSTGGAAYADLVRAQVELGMLEDAIAGLREGMAPRQADLNAASGRPVGAAVELPRTALAAEGAPVGAALPPGAPPAAVDPTAASGLAAGSPELAAMQREVEARGHERTVAVREGYPEFMIGLEWLRFGATEDPEMGGAPGQDAWMASLSLRLPLWRGKYSAMRREAAAARQEAAAALRGSRLDLEARLANALYEVRDADRRVRLYGPTLLPKGRQGLEAARAAYQGGSGDFTALIDAERVLLEFELSYRRALADRLIGASEIEMLSGRPLAAGSAATPPRDESPRPGLDEGQEEDG